MDKRAFIDRIRSNFPDKLIELDQWVCWRIEMRDGDPTKVPYAINGMRAESDNPATWSSFDEVCAAYLSGNYAGVGFMFSEHDPYAGVDLDKCVNDHEIEPRRAGWMHQLDSYSEYSQSKTGIHVIVLAALPPGRRKSRELNIEMYDRLRFFVVTGDHVSTTPLSLNERQQELTALHLEVFGKPKEKTAQPAQQNGSADIPADDQELLRRMFASKNGSQIESLWRGNVSAYNNDHSSADLALCNHLAFWTGNDAERMDRLFRMSSLARDKWDRPARTGEIYGEGTIARAIADTTQTYSPRTYTNGHSKPQEQAPPPEPEDWTPGEPESIPVQEKQEDNSYLLTEGGHDEGNAQCVHKRYQGALLHSKSLGWLYHTGTHWSMEEPDAYVDRAITETLIARMQAGLKAGSDTYGELIKKCVPNSSKVQAAKSQLSSIASVSPNHFDTERDYLNCRNGVVDLRTGLMYQHGPDQRFMHCVTANYAPDASSDVWVNWLTEAVGRPDLVDWLQLSVGYSLTGHTREEILFYLYGPPRSGKGTFTETLLALLGAPLAKEVNFSTFVAQRTGDSQNFDLAPLKPCRFVAASESNTYERFNEAKIKALTGGNEIYCAYKHRDHFNYRPQFKIWLSSNQPVNADPDDDAVWGRLRVIEFPLSHLGSEDKGLKERMRAEKIMQGVLAWAVKGAMRWYELGTKGIAELETSAHLKDDQRGELDNVQAWIDEHCKSVDGAFTASSALYQSYESWCKNNGVEAKRQKGFSQSLKRKNFKDDRSFEGGKLIRGFRGIRIT